MLQFIIGLIIVAIGTGIVYIIGRLSYKYIHPSFDYTYNTPMIFMILFGICALAILGFLCMIIFMIYLLGSYFMNL